MKLGILGFYGSLISNWKSILKNSKWPIQYGGLKRKIYLDSHKIQNLGVFLIADFNPGVKI